MTALARETLLVFAAGSRQPVGTSCVRLRKRRWWPGRSGLIHEAETEQYPVTTPWRADHAAQVPPPTSLRAVNSP